MNTDVLAASCRVALAAYLQASEALDFIYFLKQRQELVGHRDLQAAQQDAMNHIWDNDADEVWNDA